MENVRKNRDIELVATEERKNYLMSDQTIIQQTTSYRTCISHRNKITHLFMNKPIYLGLSILELSKLVM